jgi:ferric-dicitrate binding protein FerR (iron transport regulator)
MNSLKNIDEEIKLLIISYLTESINESDLNRLKQWIESGSINKEYFDKIKAYWALTGNQVNKEKSDPELQWSRLKAKIELEPTNSNKKLKTRILISAGIAASWIVFFALGSLFNNHSEKSEGAKSKTTEITAPLGAKSIVKLPDGTTVWLNAGSKISYNQDFDKSDRNVQLTGEAYFSVATNKAKPFVVKTSGILVRALGTRFNVKAYPEEKTITATLEEGKIDVQVLQNNKQNNQIVLTPNQKVVFYKKSNDFENHSTSKSVETKTPSAKISPEEKELEVAHNVNTELYTSWKDARWIIEAMPLATLTPMLERRFNMKINLNKDDLKNYNFTGIIENETIEQILAALKFTAPIDYEIQKDTIQLTLNKHLKNQYSRLIRPKKTN